MISLIICSRRLRRLGAFVFSTLLFVSGIILVPAVVLTAQAAGMVHDYDVSGGNVVINDLNSDDTYVITGTSTANNVELTVAEGVTAHVRFSDLNVNVSSIIYLAAVSLNGAGNVEIELVGDSILKSGYTRAGLQNGNTGTLTITGTGSLNATGGSQAAGIGSAYRASAGNIVIESGTVSATGGYGSAGIGSGFSNASVGDIIINNGTVTSTGGAQAAAIGSGYSDSSAGNIEINNGTVTANSAHGGAGIGAGGAGSVGNIDIINGNVTAVATGYGGAGIGSGARGTAGNIVIEGGNITSTAGQGGAGIGGGQGASRSGDIEISGGTVTATAGQGGAGIGTGADASRSGDIEISGGTVIAIAGDKGAGIGTGIGRTAAEDIVISGGTVTATGGAGAAGIGSSCGSTLSGIAISGGTVTAVGGDCGAGIGGGLGNSGGDTIVISGGNIYVSGGQDGICYSRAGTGAGIGSGFWGSAPDIIISGNPQIYVSGGAGSGVYGNGAGIGQGGRDANGTPGEEQGDFSGLLTTGAIYIYGAGVTPDQMRSNSVEPSSVTHGTVVPEVHTQAEIDHMKEVEEDIRVAIATGETQTVEVTDCISLTSAIMELLNENPQITVIMEFTYKDMDFRLTIPGSMVELEPGVEWYGPKYLFPKYHMCGSDTIPSVQEYLDAFS
ncbi:MAG: hypothetical protein J5696_07610 [Lachnospiraceae bacterium]|nr:hypothetical protein [Lachnospiraceae bacterium]